MAAKLFSKPRSKADVTVSTGASLLGVSVLTLMMRSSNPLLL